MASEAPSPRKPWLQRLLSLPWRRSSESTLRESIEHAIDEHELTPDEPGDDLSDTERTMLRNILQYGELRVEDVAVPRADIIAFNVEEGFDQLVSAFASAGHSRLPVYREALDAVVGMVHVKDVYQHLAEGGGNRPPRLDKLMRSVLFVPPSMRVLDLLARMRASRTHMAIVVDEYGGTDGLVTIEDLVEEIVGDIEDEHDEAETYRLRRLGDGSIEADARVPLAELEAMLDHDFLPEESDDEVDTLGGLVFMLVGRVPMIGEKITDESGYAFEILDGDPRRITRVAIHPPKADPESDDDTDG